MGTQNEPVVVEEYALLTTRTADSAKRLIYPITTLEAVDGAEDLIHYDSPQNLTDEQKAQVRANIGAADPCGVTYLESNDTDNLINIRDLDSGTYVFYGRFRPYAGASSTMTFSSNLTVNIVKRTSDTQVMVFYPVNNCVQYLLITDSSYERTNVYLNDIAAVQGIPSYTSSDNGKFLRVVNGVAAWDVVPSAESTSF